MPDDIYDKSVSDTYLIVLKIIKAITKLLIAAIMYACWAGLFPNYYNILIIASFICFFIVTYKEFKEGNFITGVFFLMGTIILNPVYPIDLNVAQRPVYLGLSICLVISFFIDLFKRAPKEELQLSF